LARARFFEIEDLVKCCFEATTTTTPTESGEAEAQSNLNPSSTMDTSGAKRKAIPVDPVGSAVFSARVTERKRRKIVAGRSQNSEFFFFDDMFSSFFREALRSADRIQEAVASGSRNLSDSLEFEVGLVSSAIKLIVASVVKLDGHGSLFSDVASPHLYALSNRLFETLSSLGGFLPTCLTSNNGSAPWLNSFAEQLVSCGIFLGVSRGTFLTEKLDSYFGLVDKARDLCHMVQKNKGFDFAPTVFGLVNETVLSCSVQHEDGWEDVSLTLNLTVFGVLFEVSIGSADNAAGSVRQSSVVLHPSEDVGILKRLVARLDEKWCLPDDLSLYTLDRVKPFLDNSNEDPILRLLVWQSVAWLFTTTSPQDLRILLRSDDTLGSRLVYFLIDVAFSDSNATVRDYTSRAIGDVLVSGEWFSLMAANASSDEWHQLRGDGDAASAGLRQASEQVISRLFHHIDSALHKRCSVPQSQLSFMMASKQPVSPKQDSEAASSVLSFRKSASRTLCSLCGAALLVPHTYFGRLMFEQSVKRVVRMWSGIDTGSRLESTGVCFAELSRLFMLRGSNISLKGNMLMNVAPAAFRDILVPGSSLLVGGAQDGVDSMTNSFRERQFELLSAFLRGSLIQDWSQTCVSSPNDDSDLERCLESCLTCVLSQLVVEKDYDALRLTSAYKLYLLGLKRAEHKRRKRSGTSYLESDPPTGLVVGDSSLLPVKSSSSRQWSRNLEDQTRQLCLAPGLIEQIIPLVFMRAGRSELIFFTKTVLQDKLSLKQLVTSREMLTLKNFVLELGRNPEMMGSVVRAMETAAVARNQDSCSSLEGSFAGPVRSEESAVNAWVTTHFMYLLVNVVQFRWAAKNDDLRVEALRSLVAVIEFLRPSEAPQYLPQIMATVNAALSCGTNVDAIRERPLSHLELRRLAVQVLSKFVKLVAETQKSVLGENLTTIVVSLIPVLSDDEQWNDAAQTALVEESRNDAVAMLDFLTQGHLGKYLAPSFSEIPFLPPSSALDSVRASLRTLGVNFDNLQVASTQGTQHDTAARGELSDNGSISVDSRGAAHNASRQSALRKRLETVCSLLGDENASVRRVVLQHFTALLRENRELFHALVENESSASMKRYLTVAYPGRKGM